MGRLLVAQLGGLPRQLLLRRSQQQLLQPRRAAERQVAVEAGRCLEGRGSVVAGAGGLEVPGAISGMVAGAMELVEGAAGAGVVVVQGVVAVQRVAAARALVMVVVDEQGWWRCAGEATGTSRSWCLQ